MRMSPAAPYDPTPNESATWCCLACTRFPSDIVGESDGIVLTFAATPPMTLNPGATKYSTPADAFHTGRERTAYVTSNVAGVAAPPVRVVDWAVIDVLSAPVSGNWYEPSTSTFSVRDSTPTPIAARTGGAAVKSPVPLVSTALPPPAPAYSSCSVASYDPLRWSDGICRLAPSVARPMRYVAPASAVMSSELPVAPAPSVAW